VISLLVLLITLLGIVGTWIARGVVIDVGTAVLTGIEEVAGIGREAATTVNGVVTEVQSVTGQVETAVDEIAQNVSDQGLVLTLLPPEQEQKIYDAAAKISETVASIVSTFNALQDLLDAIDSIPFVEAPRLDPEKVANLESTAEAISNELEQFAASIQQFRDDAAGNISRVSGAAGAVTDRLDTTVTNLNEVDSALANVQTRAQTLRENLATIVTVIAVVITLILAWVVYGMAALTRNHWRALHPAAPQPAAIAVAPVTEPEVGIATTAMDTRSPVDTPADTSADDSAE
jgi:hypothetical protein